MGETLTLPRLREVGMFACNVRATSVRCRWYTQPELGEPSWTEVRRLAREAFAERLPVLARIADGELVVPLRE